MGGTNSISGSVTANLTDLWALLAWMMFSTCRFSLNDNISRKTKLESVCHIFAHSFTMFCSHWKHIWVNTIVISNLCVCTVSGTLQKARNSLCASYLETPVKLSGSILNILFLSSFPQFYGVCFPCKYSQKPIIHVYIQHICEQRVCKVGRLLHHTHGHLFWRDTCHK